MTGATAAGYVVIRISCAAGGPPGGDSHPHPSAREPEYDMTDKLRRAFRAWYRARDGECGQ